MKHLFLTTLAALTIGFAGKAQNFVGTITYRMQVKNPPAGVSAAMVEQLVPSKMVLHVGPSQMATLLNIGPFTKSINPIKGDTAYMVSEKAKTIYTLTAKSGDTLLEGGAVSKPVVKKTNQTSTISGYPCTLYEITMSVKGMDIKQYTWATEKVILPKTKVNTESMLNMDVPGLVVKTSTKMMGMDIELEMTDISMTPPDPAVFQLPALPHLPLTPENIMKTLGGK